MRLELAAMQSRSLRDDNAIYFVEVALMCETVSGGWLRLELVVRPNRSLRYATGRQRYLIVATGRPELVPAAFRGVESEAGVF